MARIYNLFSRFFDSEKMGGLLLIICTIVSISIANSYVGDEYLHLINSHLDLSYSAIHLDFSLQEWVNDALMAVFFLMVGLEVERELYIGELSSFKKAILPVAAAAGGMLFPVCIHLMLNHGTSTESGFAIPMATDIAFALGVLSLAGKRVPVSIKVFLAALAIIDDIGAVLVIAIFYSKTILMGYLIAAMCILAMLVYFNLRGMKKLSFYLIPGIVLWYCLLQSGVHATIAGVLLAFAIPFRKTGENISYKLQQWLHKPVAFIIVPVFALVNTAIIIPANIGSRLIAPNPIGIIAGLYVGKAAGIFLFPYVLVKAGVARLPKRISWKDIAGIGFLGGIGFTMSMFICNLAFNDNDIIVTSKLSILLSSSISAITGWVVFILRRRKINPHLHQSDGLTVH